MNGRWICFGLVVASLVGCGRVRGPMPPDSESPTTEGPGETTVRAIDSDEIVAVSVTRGTPPQCSEHVCVVEIGGVRFEARTTDVLLSTIELADLEIERGDLEGADAVADVWFASNYARTNWEINRLFLQLDSESGQFSFCRECRERAEPTHPPEWTEIDPVHYWYMVALGSWQDGDRMNFWERDGLGLVRMLYGEHTAVAAYVPVDPERWSEQRRLGFEERIQELLRNLQQYEGFNRYDEAVDDLQRLTSLTYETTEEWQQWWTQAQSQDCDVIDRIYVCDLEAR